MRRVVGAVICVAVPAAISAAGCNGTNGREGLPIESLPTLADATAPDADAGLGADGGGVADAGPDSFLTGLFDVDILYTDRALPEAQAAVEGGQVEAGPVLPSCPAFLPTDGVGNVSTFVDSLIQVPSDIGPDGGIEIAPDGSVCASYPWLASVATDECVAGAASPTFAMLPPCVSAIDAGAAVHGDGMGQARYDLCIALYNCYVRTGCYLDPTKLDVTWCFCGANSAACAMQPQGACLTEVLDALEVPKSMAAASATQIVNDFTTVSPTTPLAGLAAHQLNFVFHQAITTHSDCTSVAQQGWAASHDASAD